MSTRLRIFISSTMKDLGNERRAVAAKLRALNLEPVNAERLHPDGGTSWDVIRNEIAGSDLFILLSGESYGFIPKDGPGAGKGKSITHMEFEYADSIGLPILPFFKRLSGQWRSKDARNREEFRRQVADWATGRFRQEFDWDDDLAEKVGDALLDVFQKSVLKDLAARARVKTASSTPIGNGSFLRVAVPPKFVGTDAILFAGAGLSAAAGFPTAEVMTGLFARKLGLEEQGDRILARHRFADVALAVELGLGRGTVEQTVVEAFNIAQGAVPTPGHMAAVASFRQIVTTNYDDLFERAARARGKSYRVLHPNGLSRGHGTDLTIFQVDGSIVCPESLVVTEEDAVRARKDEGYWSEISGAMGERPVMVVGHSLRDENARKVLATKGSGPGLYLSLRLDPLDRIVRERFGLQGCVGTADNFLRSFEEESIKLAGL
ncbi:DUF4062 domain-containing protein [Rhizobium leguminosarum]|uniref:DUF4062 domain-containing protein n=1 Tax=Rhizobium leguminosarum TaxID=384 RepID=UPI001406C9C5|nr:DUF4062 domain-containing protein [Rhizobium leguminosarum]NEH52427.1 DUF4062 domain-containing protein [Rhizobium leguminosarum]